jgi:hypothetical protein
VIVQLTLEYAKYITANMSKDDLAEILATHWLDTTEGFAEQCFNAAGINLCALANDGTPIAMGGVALLQPKIGTAWMVGTERMIEKRLEVTKHCKQGIKKSLDSGLVHRVHAFASGLHYRTHPWLLAIGLKQETILKKWGKGGEDFILFSLTR